MSFHADKKTDKWSFELILKQLKEPTSIDFIYFFR